MDDRKPLKILLVNTARSSFHVDRDIIDSIKDPSKKISADPVYNILLSQGSDQDQQAAFDAMSWSRTPRMPGIYLLADRLRKQGHFVETIEHIPYWTTSQIDQWHAALKNIDFDLIGFSTTFLSASYLNSLISYFKNRWPKAITVAGAIGQSLEINVDYYVTGFGEKALLAIIDRCFYDIKGLKYTVMPNKTKLIDAITFYPTHLQDKEYSYKLKQQDLWHLPGELPMVELSRGCRFKCAYCDFPLIGLREDTSVDEEELYRFLQQAYDDFGIVNFGLADDTPNNTTEQIRKLVKAVRRLNFQPKFGGFARLDLFKTQPEQIELFAEAYIQNVQYGIETLHRETGKIIGKGMRREDVLETLDNTYQSYKRWGREYYAQLNMIQGLPKLSNEQFMEDVRLLKQFSVERDYHASVHNHVLFIIQPEGQVVKSAFGVDMTKYGYKEMTTDKVVQVLEKYGLFVEEEAIIKARKEAFKEALIWENEHTNFIDCLLGRQAIANEIYTQGPSTWEMHNINYKTWEPTITQGQAAKQYIQEKLLHTKLYTKNEINDG